MEQKEFPVNQKNAKIVAVHLLSMPISTRMKRKARRSLAHIVQRCFALMIIFRSTCAQSNLLSTNRTIFLTSLQLLHLLLVMKDTLGIGPYLMKMLM